MYPSGMTVSEKLKIIQRLTGKPQEKLADDLGVSFPTLNSWINDRSTPHPKALERIDELYLRLTGQKTIPASALEAKNKILEGRRKKYRDIIETIVSAQDLYDEFLLSLTYNTNRIEGSTLTEDDTAAILFDNATLPDKSLTEHLEVKNHEAALKFLFRYLEEGDAITEEFGLKLHSILMNGIREDAGFYRRHAVRIVGSNVPTANYLKVPKLMKSLFRQVGKKSQDVVHKATETHSHFEQIHPFSDGNGRVGRLLLCAMLLKENFPPAVIRQESRRFYIAALRKSQLDNDLSLLEDFVCDAILNGFDILERK